MARMNGKVLSDPTKGIPSPRAVAKRLGLRKTKSEHLCICRQRRGSGWVYTNGKGRAIHDKATIRRLNRLAVPPAYREVLFANDPAVHLQAVGRDAAGRMQYRYHPAWDKVREVRKARRLVRLARELPRIKRSLAIHLKASEPKREFAAAAVVELVANSAIRAGCEDYARLHRTRGATTLLKSNVTVGARKITLDFRAKGGKQTRKELEAQSLAKALRRLLKLPGKRLFQYQTQDGEIRPIDVREVNAFLHEITGGATSLKDFRTLLACERTLDRLAATEPAKSERQCRKQIAKAVALAADDLANTPAVARKSYVHGAILRAFERGVLKRFSQRLKSARSRTGRARMLAEIIVGAID